MIELDVIGLTALYILAGFVFSGFLCTVCRENCHGPEDFFAVWITWPWWLAMFLTIAIPCLAWFGGVWLLRKAAEDSLVALQDLGECWFPEEE